jgi:aminoglycoside 6'-N-acetyltransferase
VLSGGDGGVAAAVNRGCRSVGGDTLALLKWNRLNDAGDEVTWSLPTSMDLARSNILNWCGDGVIAFEGRYGTLGEIALALDTGRPLLLLGRHTLLDVTALNVPSCRVVEDPKPEHAARLVDLLESLITAGRPAPVRPVAALFTAEPVDGEIGLRRTVPGDADLFRRAFRDPEVLEWWALDPTSDVLARFQHERCLAIVERGRSVGFLDYHAETDPDFDHVGLDVVIADAADRGRSIGSRAVRLFAAAVFAAGHHRVTVVPSPDNKRAIRCYEKVGFRRVGVMRDYERYRGRWRDALLMDLIPSDLTPAASASSAGPDLLGAGHS